MRSDIFLDLKEVQWQILCVEGQGEAGKLQQFWEKADLDQARPEADLDQARPEVPCKPSAGSSFPTQKRTMWPTNN